MESCLAMQAEHLTALQRGCLTKINQWLEERQTMVASLRQVMANVKPTEVDTDLRELLLDKIGCILDREKAINMIAEQQRTGLVEQLVGMRRGKRALSGYGAAHQARSPKYFSDNG